MNFKTLLPHIVAVSLFLLLNLIYFYPQVEGLKPEQKDIVDYEAMEGEVNEFERRTGEKVYWNNGMFGGMPWGMMIYGRDNNLLSYSVDVLQFGFYRPLGIFLKAMLLCYLCLVLLGVNPWLSMLGAIAFGFNTNHFVLMEIGHINKLNVLANLPLLLTGTLLIFRDRWKLGGLLFALGSSFVIYHNHPQMLYYFLLLLGVYGLAKMVQLFTTKGWKKGASILGIFLFAGILGFATNLSQLVATQIFTEDTTRGKNILTEKESDRTGSDESGLDFDYAMEFSNGWLDLGSLLIPSFVGGATGEETTVDTKVGKLMQLNNAPRKASGVYETQYYWGKLPFTTGPYYMGAAVLLLFVFGLFYLDTYARTGVITAVVLALMISLGDTLAWFNHLLFDYLPYFDKFRAPNSIMNVLPPFLIIFGFTGLQSAIDQTSGKAENTSAIRLLKKVAIPLLGICLFFALFGPFLFSFTSPSDELVQKVIDSFIYDRKALMRTESFRSFMVAGLTALILWLSFSKRVKSLVIIAALLFGIIVLDQWTVGQRYFDRDDFVPYRTYQKNFEPRPADEQIFKAESRGRGFYRVVDYSINTYASSYTSSFHNHIGGYYAAKLQRMQDLIDHQIQKGNREVLDMLNVKYVINQDGNPSKNPAANGTAWFVSNIVKVDSPDKELEMLSEINTNNTAVFLEEEFIERTGPVKAGDGTGSIELVDYHPNRLKYNARTSSEQVAVFPEVWFGPDKGWTATIDGKEVPIFRVNYVLRALKVPAGAHNVVFRFHPNIGAAYEYAALGSSLLLILASLTYLFFELRKRLSSTS